MRTVLRHVLVLVTIVPLASFVSAVAIAQDHGHSHGPPSSDHPMTPEEIQARVARTEEYLQRVDVNKNGLIDAEEANGPAKYIMDKIVERTGRPIQFPVAISQLKQMLTSAYAAQASASPPSSPPSASPSTKPGAPVPGMLNAPNSMAFGTTLSVQGFGDPAAVAKAASSSKSAGPPASAAANLDRDMRHKLHDLVVAFMKKYDKNGDQRLDRSEWPGGRYGTFDEANRNGGSVVSVEELTVQLTDLCTRGVITLDEMSPTSMAMKSGRFLTPVERLPKDTPRWFQDLDRDHDGQITMAEYARERDWTREKAEEFDRKDLNHDGVITPDEAIKAEGSRRASR
jgi:hypothetical protein